MRRLLRRPIPMPACRARPQVWNNRPVRADRPEEKVWVRERSGGLEGQMGAGAVGSLAAVGHRMLAGAADGGIRVFS